MRLPWPHRVLAQAKGRLPQAASGACPSRIGRLPKPHRALAQAASGACPSRIGRLPKPHRALAPGCIGRLPRPHRGAPPVSIYAALIGRTPNRFGWAHSRYLCKRRDWAHSQSYAAVIQLFAISGRAHFRTDLCNYSPFTEAGRTPRPSVATWVPSMPTPPRKRLRDLPSWSGPMAIAGILPLALINAVHTAEQEWAKRKRRVRMYQVWAESKEGGKWVGK